MPLATGCCGAASRDFDEMGAWIQSSCLPTQLRAHPPPSLPLPSHSTDREVAAVALLGFVAYQLAEGLHLSGIFSVFFCGIAMRWVGGWKDG